MFFHVYFLVLISLVFAATFKIKDVVLTRGLQTTRYEDRLAVVVGHPVTDSKGQTRLLVVVWLGFNKLENSISSLLRIKPDNLEIFTPVEVDFDADDQGNVARISTYMQCLDGLIRVIAPLDKQFSQALYNLITNVMTKEFGSVGWTLATGALTRYDVDFA
jgi:hypothetical protein